MIVVSQTLPTLLVVEDDVDLADMLNAYFSGQGYKVVTANWGEDAIQASRSHLPDLVILDIRLPDIDGYEVARRLRSNRRTSDIPIIFLTEKRDRADRLQGLGLGADDYITKPFDIQELRLRVRNALHRSTQGSLTNLVTGLPEGALVEERLSEILQSDGWAILQVSLRNLDRFNETYGFVASDDVQRAVSLMIQNAVRDTGNTGDFIGQLGPTDFLIVTTPQVLENLQERIHNRLKQSLDYFYPVKDRQQGVKPAERLNILIARLLASEGPFVDTNGLKMELFNRL